MNIAACATPDTIQLSATVTGSATVEWTGGNGEFLPNNNTLNAQYVIDLADTVGGNITLTLSTTGNDGCAVSRDSITLNFTAPPTVSINPASILVCANNPDFTVTAEVMNAIDGFWIGMGTFSPSVDSLTVTYTPTQPEIDLGLTSITYRAIGGNACENVDANVDIIIIPAPIADAGGPDTICKNNPSIQLSGSASNANIFYWTGGDGSFDDSTQLNATYTASQLEITNGIPIQLILHVNQDTTCNEVVDTLIIFFKDPPTVDAGANQNICENNFEVSLSGTISGATGSTWSGGNGIFANTNSLSTVYTPSSGERVSGNSVTLYLTADQGLAGCNEVTDSMTISFTPSPTVDAGEDISVCRNNIEIILNGSVTVATGGIWSGGNNNISPSNTTLTDARYNPSDAERNSNGFHLVLTTTGNGNCNAVSDSVFVEITDIPTIIGFADDTVCVSDPSVFFSVTTTVATGVFWSGGQGTYDPSNTSLNITYTPSTSEIANLSYDLTVTTTDNQNCNAVSETRTVTLLRSPIVNAGPSIIACQSDINVQLNGGVINAGGIIWSTLGSGTFNDNTALNTVYTASSDDINNRAVSLVITTTNSNPCAEVTDTTLIEFEDEPSVDAGPNMSVCTNDFPIQLNASGSTGSWSGGNGTFTPNNTFANALYNPTQAEIDNNLVILTYTSNQSAGQLCPQVSDDVRIEILNGPQAFAGNDTSICGNENFQLDGRVINSNSGFWQTINGTGSFSPNQSTLNATYITHPTELSDTDTTFITFVLSANGIGICPVVFDTIVVGYTPDPTVDAGANQTLCGNVSTVQLAGQFTNASGVIWSGGSGGVFNNVNIENPTYTPNAIDLAGDSIVFTLTTTASAACEPVSDQVVIYLIAPPIVEAGPDVVVCEDTSYIMLNGNIQNAMNGVWSTSGSGIFTPTPADSVSRYVLSDDDVALGSFNLFLESTGNGVCPAVRDSLLVTLTESPLVFAGPDSTVCADADPIVLNGSDNGISGGIEWSTSGTGTFSDIIDANATYTLSNEDIIDGVVTLSIRTINNGDCQPSDDNVVLTITPSTNSECRFSTIGVYY